MRFLEFRRIPGYDSYGANQVGVVYCFVTGEIVKQFLFNGYYISDAFYGAKTETLPVHRAVALAWIENPDSSTKTMVNHIDGVKTNNDVRNLEWVTPSENNYHAVATGLSSDNVPCLVRDFFTGKVYEFPSINQAGEFMGYQSRIGLNMLYRKQFGALIKNQYEFRFKDDTTPWFYESRPNLITPARYRVRVTDCGGVTKEVYSNRRMLAEFQLYDSPYGKSIPGLVRYAREKYPTWQFELDDSYAKEKDPSPSKVMRTPPMEITATRENEVVKFPSLRHTARYFNVDRKSITHRLINNTKDLDGWTFTYMAS